MRNVLIAGLLVVVALSCFLGGCSNSACPIASAGALAVDSSREAVNSHSYGENVIETRTERFDRYNLIRDIEDREFWDDVDTILLTTWSSRLTEWHPGVYR